VAAGLVLGLLAMVVVAIATRGNISPRLTPELFQVAMAQWKQEGPQDYNIEIQVRGNQPATYYVEVRGGDARVANSATANR
jgi:hypothetical protein